MNLTKEHISYINKSILCWLATSSRDNVPNVSPKEVFTYYGTDNLIIVSAIIYGFYYYSFKYTIKRFPNKPNKLTDFVSVLYFHEPGKFHQILYKMPKDKNVLIGHIGYIFIRVVIVASFLATIHNLCQFYHVPVYDTFREIVRRPLYVIYGLILASLVYFTLRLWKKEFEYTTTS